MATLRTDTGGAAYVGKDRADGEVNVYVVQRPETAVARIYDGTTVAVGAGLSVDYDVTTALGGTNEVSVYVVEMTQAYTVTVLSRPHTALVLFSEAVAYGTAATLDDLTVARFGFSFVGPLSSVSVTVRITNTSASAATLKGVYVSGR